MQGNPRVIQELNSLLTGELSSADQYFVHARMYENWGYHELFKRIDHEREEELTHAAQLVHRILFLSGTPDVASRNALKIGANVPDMLKNDLDLELQVVSHLRKTIALCEKEQDFETRRMLIGLLHETEEDHARWLEVQLRLVGEMGVQNYLQSAAGHHAAAAENK